MMSVVSLPNWTVLSSRVTESTVFTVLIGGKAGEGVKKAAQVVAHTLMACGKHVFQMDDYQSVIKGGHNFSVVSSSDAVVYGTYAKADLLISFDDLSISKHEHELNPEGLHFCNADDCSSLSTPALKLPLTTLMKQHYSTGGNVSVAAIAIVYAALRLPEDELQTLIAKEFKRNINENTAYAMAIYALVGSEAQIPFTTSAPNPARFISGNQAISLGAWLAGLEYYYSYPMTPASSILHYLALKQESHRVYAIHAESELAAANMAIGSIVAGKRAAVGTSGGGFALMQEAFSLAGMVEAPLLCILSSRPGPATGVSTYTAQEDLFFALHAGHGEFPRIVASPDSFERAFSLAAELLELAWATQSPSILLTEKHLSESCSDISLPLEDVSVTNTQELQPEPYNRYTITDSGVSPLKYPGTGNCNDDDVIKWNSNEHNEAGWRTDTSEGIIAMKDKRQRKAALINSLSRKNHRIAEYGHGSIPVFAYGSTALELREAMKHTPFKLVVPIYLEPFPFEELEQYRGMPAIVVEHSQTGLFTEFLINKLNIRPIRKILRYDGRSWDPVELANLVQEALNA